MEEERKGKREREREREQGKREREKGEEIQRERELKNFSQQPFFVLPDLFLFNSLRQRCFSKTHRL